MSKLNTLVNYMKNDKEQILKMNLSFLDEQCYDLVSSLLAREDNIDLAKHVLSSIPEKFSNEHKSRCIYNYFERAYENDYKELSKFLVNFVKENNYEHKLFDFAIQSNSSFFDFYTDMKISKFEILNSFFYPTNKLKI